MAALTTWGYMARRSFGCQCRAGDINDYTFYNFTVYVSEHSISTLVIIEISYMYVWLPVLQFVASVHKTNVMRTKTNILLQLCYKRPGFPVGIRACSFSAFRQRTPFTLLKWTKSCYDKSHLRHWLLPLKATKNFCNVTVWSSLSTNDGNNFVRQILYSCV